MLRRDSTWVVAAVKVVVDVEGIPVSVYSLHATRPSLTLRPFVYKTDWRSDDVAGLVKVVANDPNPVIVFCDCNFSDATEDYQLMTTVLQDAWKQKGVGLGLTAPVPDRNGGFPILLLRSDYIWHTHHFETVSVDILPIDASDHFPVFARLRFHVDKIGK